MMEVRAASFGKILYSLNLKEEEIKKSLQILSENTDLKKALENPAITREEKNACIDDIFPKELRSVVKVICEKGCIDVADQIFEEYEICYLDSIGILKAKLSYAKKLTDDELEQMKEMICKKYNKVGVRLELVEDASLIGGYVLTVGDTVYDKSIKETLLVLGKTLTGR